MEQCIAICKWRKGRSERIVVMIVYANKPKTMLINQAMYFIEVRVVTVFAIEGGFDVDKDINCRTQELSPTFENLKINPSASIFKISIWLIFFCFRNSSSVTTRTVSSRPVEFCPLFSREFHKEQLCNRT